MILPVNLSDRLDNALRANLHEARTRYEHNPNPDNRLGYQQALRTFADWVLREKLPDGFQDELISAKTGDCLATDNGY